MPVSFTAKIPSLSSSSSTYHEGPDENEDIKMDEGRKRSRKYENNDDGEKPQVFFFSSSSLWMYIIISTFFSLFYASVCSVMNGVAVWINIIIIEGTGKSMKIVEKFIKCANHDVEIFF